MRLDSAIGLRSDFSVGESMLRIDKMVERAKSLGYKSIALADTNSINGAVSFAGECKDAGIKPILGVVVKVFDDPKLKLAPKKEKAATTKNHSVSLKFYARNENGFKGIMKLLSIANEEEHFYYYPRVGWDHLGILGRDDVVVTTGDIYSLWHHPLAKEKFLWLTERFSHVFFEIVPVNTPLYDTLNTKAYAIANANPLPSRALVTYPTLYANQDDADTLDVLRAITTNGKMTQPWLPIPYVRDYFMRSPVDLLRATAQVKTRLPELPWVDGLSNTSNLADLCDFTVDKKAPCLPKMADDEFASLMGQVKAGWTQRFSGPVLGDLPDAARLPIYRDRLAYELSVLKKMGFSGYFLLVQEIVAWAKSNGIMVGPGRGSVGGSLVAYLLGITDVDPIRFNLLFERFINPERIDLPDADLDFMSLRREEVIAHIVERYGVENVAGISNYNALGAASSLRDVSRVHELPMLEYECSKQVDKVHGVSVSLEEAAEGAPDIDKYKNKYPSLWKHAVSLEGNIRSLGKHAAGVVVGGEPLINRAVVETRKGGAVVNWDKRYVEDWGLIKMDILGLSTLDMLELGRQYIKQMTGTNINYLDLALDDPKVLGNFGTGETSGIFQFESSGMRKLLRELAVGGTVTFDDMVAVTALYRPGPLDAGLCDDYVAIKQGSKRPSYEHPNMEPALVQTYGVIVYQEQVMQIARDVAGFTMAEADHLRKAMGKKDKDMMAKQRAKWVDGCVNTSGMDQTIANSLFDKIEVFAGYAFNKSHSVEYSIISYWAMWLKTHYPAAFFAASITIADKEEKIAPLVIDARRFDIQVVPPDIIKSSHKIEIGPDQKTLYLPFQAIKGISEKVSENIKVARNHAVNSTTGLTKRDDFYAALIETGIGGKVNVRHKEALERVGAFAEIEQDKFKSTHPDRLKDRFELLPGYTVDMVKPNRGIPTEQVILVQVTRMMDEARRCTDCSLQGRAHPLPRVGAKPRFMIVFDAPNYNEERGGTLLVGDVATILQSALTDAGLTFNDGYFTTLVKAGKPRDQKTLTNEQITACSPRLMKEIEILKPPVIVTMGAAATKFFLPGLKGPMSDMIGKVVFDAKLDASIVVGLNPAQILFNPGKLQELRKVCQTVYDVIS